MILRMDKIDAGYGGKQVLFDVSVRIDDGEIVAIIGPNGSGKSTALKVAIGLLPPWRGEVTLDDDVITRTPTIERVRRGIGFAPQGSRVFDELSVQENLEAGGYGLSTGERRGRIDEMLGLFPLLKELLRKGAGQLSGGEQQVLSLARVLMGRPRVLMLDEPSLGLSPLLVRAVMNHVQTIRRAMKIAILIVEQNVKEALTISDRVYVLKEGRVFDSGIPAEFSEDSDRLKAAFL